MAKHIPELNKKFRFLIERGYVESLEAIAEHFDKKVDTIQWWEHGDPARAPNSVTNASLGALFDLIASTLPKPQSSAFVWQLIDGPFDAFQRAFDLLSETTLDDLIASEGRPQGIRIVYKGSADLFEIDSQRADRAPQFIPANAFFRLEIDAAFSDARATTLRFHDNAWIPTPTAVDDDGCILVPGRLSSGQPSFMRETEPDRAVRFVIVQTASLLPNAVDFALRQKTVLDLGALSSIASAYEREPQTRRALHVLDVKTIAPDEHAD